MHSPTLLASLDVSVEAVQRQLQPTLESLLEWMARRAVGHVRQLRLEVWVLPNRFYNHVFEQDEDDYEPPFEGDVDSLAAMMSAILMHGSSLRSLAVDIHPPGLLPPLGPWLAPLRGLTSLSLECSDIVVNGPLACLTALQQLQLLSRPYEHLSHACALRMRPGVVALPPTLTSLCLNALRGGFPGEVRLLDCCLLAGGVETSSLGARRGRGSCCCSQCNHLAAAGWVYFDLVASRETLNHLNNARHIPWLPHVAGCTACPCLLTHPLPIAPATAGGGAATLAGVDDAALLLPRQNVQRPGRRAQHADSAHAAQLPQRARLLGTADCPALPR